MIKYNDKRRRRRRNMAVDVDVDAVLSTPPSRIPKGSRSYNLRKLQVAFLERFERFSNPHI
jgi:hypothetical protein